MATKVVCLARLLKCLRSLSGKHVDPDQTAPIGAVCSGSTLFASIVYSSVILSNYLQQTTSADDIFRCFFLGALTVNYSSHNTSGIFLKDCLSNVPSVSRISDL